MHIGPSARRRSLTAVGAVVVAWQLALPPAAATQWVADGRLWGELPVDDPGCYPGLLNTCGADMRLVESALTTSERLWSFITAPDTGYFERRVAASRAGRLFPPEWIPRIAAARRELSAEASLHWFGLFDRLNSTTIFPKGASPRDGLLDPQRVILGHVFVVPGEWVPYPLTDDGLKRLPWPSQVSTALRDLVMALTFEGNASAIDSVALTLPCTDYYSRRLMLELTHGVAHRQGIAPPAVFGTWLNLLRRPDFNVASVGLQPRGLAQINEPMAEVLALEYVARGAYIGGMATRARPALLLGSLRLVLSQDYRRRYGVDSQARGAARLREAINAPPTPIPWPSSNDAALEAVVESISRWFSQVEPELERLAELDRPRLDAARRQLEAATTCRP